MQAHPAFEPLRSERIGSLNLRVEQFEHRATGAMHCHLAADNNENVFLVALRTVPRDSTGVAHILEHTALCGSERYPVRDPFFMMLRRSLNTFMNAFTSSDWTAYPFASQNRKDFDNLLDVYLDAVFFPRLDPLDFAQEGHRLEFAEPGNSDSELVFKGVVFNEMKGAMSAAPNSLWQHLCHHLFPSTTYHYNSGGDPRAIPELSHARLVDFHRSHYHPGNAIFMTYGDIPAAAHQEKFERRALCRFGRPGPRIAVPRERRLGAPLRAEERYACDEASSAGKTHIVVAWLLGESCDLESLLEAHLLSSVLLDNSASPLQRALETTALGQAPSPLGGLDDSMREMVFVCGLEGSEAAHRDAVESLVLEVVAGLARDGIDHQRLAAVLQQLELQQREVSGDGYPYGLQLIFTALGCAAHYGDPVTALDIDPALERLRERIRDPGYIRQLASGLLLDNPHRVTLVMRPDRELSGEERRAERERLAARKAGLDDAQKLRIIERAAQLELRQRQVEDAAVLPKVELADVPAELPEPRASALCERGRRIACYRQGTNGLVYQQAVAALPPLGQAQTDLLPCYSDALTEVGLGDSDYLEVQQRRAAICGGLDACVRMRGGVADAREVGAYFVLSSKALCRHGLDAARLMRDTLAAARFDELPRLRELVARQRARREQAVTGSGHALAMAAACAGMSPVALLGHRLSGLAGIRSCKALDESLNDAGQLADFGRQLAELHAELASRDYQLLAIGEEGELESLARELPGCWADFGAAAGPVFAPEPVQERRGELWITDTQVNFCARAYPTVAPAHPDAPALAVLGGFLRNGFLHRAIRERGGAYGGGASQDSNSGAFRFYSYRDPRLEETVADFDAAIDWLLSASHQRDELEQAILGVISALDRPGSPAGEARRHFHDQLFGRSHALRQRFRQQVLRQGIADLQRVARSYLAPERASTAIITSQAGADAASAWVSRQGLDIIEL